MNGGMMMGGPMMAMAILLLVLFLVLVGAGVAWLVHRQTRGLPRRQADAIDRLEWRYAGGEIDRDEFLQRRQDLLDVDMGRSGRS